MKNVLEGVGVTYWREQTHWRYTDLDLNSVSDHFSSPM